MMHFFEEFTLMRPGTGHIVLVEDNDGNRYHWPLPKSQLEIEDLVVSFLCVGVNPEAIIYTNEDFDKYVNVSDAFKERVLLE